MELLTPLSSYAELNYIIRVVICSGLFWAVARLLLGRIGHNTMRCMILLCTALSLVLPLIKIGIYYPAAPQVSTVIDPLAYPVYEIATHAADTSPWFTWSGALRLAYWIVVAVLSVRMAWGLVALNRLRKASSAAQIGSTRVLVNSAVESPFSFMNDIFIGAIDNPTDLQMVVTHESAHVRHRHSREVLALEIVTIAAWMNPFFYLLKSLLREVHEYQADSEVAERGYDIEKYKSLIFRQIVGRVPELAGALTHSLTKKRIIMLTKKTTISGAKALLFIPTTLAVMALVSFTTRNAEPLPETFTPTQISNDSIFVGNGIQADKNKTPLMIFDGQKITLADMKNLNPDLIGSMTVLKGDAAIVKYGSEGRNGVIEISSQSSVFMDSIVKKEKEPLMIYDGQKITPADMKNLDPDLINSMTVLKGKVATIEYGAEGSNGVVKITSKSAFDADPTAGKPLFGGKLSTQEFPLWCAENLKYPSSAVTDKLEGDAVVYFVVEIDGTLADIKISRSSGHSVLDDAALELVRSAPLQWTAAKDEKGNATRYPLQVPIRFSLK